MAAVPKAQKEKSHGGNPKLVPRQTAASAARAARIATNRNLALPTAQTKQSAPSNAKMKTQNPLKSASITDVKECKQESSPENSPRSEVVVMDALVTDHFQLPAQTNANINVTKIEELEAKADGNGQSDLDRSEVIRSRPSTPRSAQSSRPSTPMVSSDLPTTAQVSSSSRANNPRPPSRPSTPSSNTMRSCSSSRPNTPRVSLHSPPPRAKTIAPDPNTHVQNSPPKTNKEEDLKSVFASKQKRYNLLKKELDLKQQEVLVMFDSLRQVRDRMREEGLSGAGEGHIEDELVMFNVADWTAAEVSQMLRDALPSEHGLQLINNINQIDERTFAELNSKAMSVPATFADLCLNAFTTRAELIDWVKDLVSQNEEGAGESIERITKYDAEGLQLCEVLQNLKDQATVTVSSLIQLARQACHERSALVAVGQAMLRELAKLREDLRGRQDAIEETNENTVVKQLTETKRDLEEERATKNALKEKLAAAEQQVRQTRARMAKMDRQLREADASIVTLTNTVKSLEDQSRQKEVQLEARARKLRDSLKSGEFTSQQIAQQRDTFQAEAAQLKEQIEKLVSQHKTEVQDLNAKIKEYNTSLGEQIKTNEKEMEAKLVAESALEESQREIEQLKAKVTELINSRPNPDLPTEREMDLWAELQATKETLRMTEDEVTACKREKVRFLETLTKIAETDNKVGMQQKLAAELLSKEEIVAKMQCQMRDMSKTFKLNEQKLHQYEQYVHSLQEYNNKNVSQEPEDQQGYHYQELQQEIMGLKMNLLEVVHRNEELSEMLAQKDQLLDHQEKTSRAQARVIKVREELINMLKNKESEQSQELCTLQQDLEHRMRVVEEVNKQIADKADEIQELFSTLESKQQQIHRLEKIVVALEEQHRRAQAQRTRHEEKIAALEHELASAGSRRERKFIFF